MALGPIANLPIPSQPTAPARDVGSAQRAFFQAALGKTEPAAAPTPVAATTVAPRPTVAATNETNAPKPTYRPGSLLDITI